MSVRSPRWSVLATVCLATAFTIAAAGDDPAAKSAAPQPFEALMAGPASALAVSPDGKWLAAADDAAGQVVLFATSGATRTIVARSEPQTGAWSDLVFTADSAFLVAQPFPNSPDCCVLHVISTSGAKEVATIGCSMPGSPQSGDGRLLQVAPDPGGSRVLLRMQHAVEVWDAGAGVGRRRAAGHGVRD